MYILTIIKQQNDEIIDVNSELFTDESCINDYLINYCEEIASMQDEPIEYEDHVNAYMAFRDINGILHRLYVCRI